MFRALKCYGNGKNLNPLNFLFKTTRWQLNISVSSKSFGSGEQRKQLRENKELDKIEKYWEKVDSELAEKEKISLVVEEKYKFKKIFIGKNIRQENQQLDQSIKENLVTVYYIPLIEEDGELLKNFSPEVAEKIYKGGRLVLLKEITEYNRSNPLEKHLKITTPFEPLSKEEIEELQNEFVEFYEDEKLFHFVLQNGRSMYNEIKAIRDEKLKKFNQTIKKINYIENYGEVINKYPVNSKINTEFQKYEDPKYVSFFLNEKKFDEAKTTEKLKNIYFEYYKNIENCFKNKTKIENNKIEPHLLERTNAFLDYLKFNNLKFEIEKDNLPPEKEDCYIFEKLFFKGVRLNRYQNDEPSEYILIDTHEDLGIRYYLHKYLTGDSNKAMTKSLFTPFSVFNSDEHHSSVSYYVKDRNRKILLRVYMFIRHPYKYRILNNTNTNLVEYKEDFTYSHLAVFENELIAPSQTFLVKSDFESWLAKHKLDDWAWKLVDLDNFMQGNPFFMKKTSFEDTYSRILDDTNYTINNIEKKFPSIKNYENFSLKFESKEIKKPAKTKGSKEKDEKIKKGKNQSETPPPETSLEKYAINSLSYDYEIETIPRPIKEDLPNYLEEQDYINLQKEYNKLLEQEILKKASSLDEEKKRQVEFEKNLEQGIDTHSKLEKLYKLIVQDKNQPKTLIEQPSADLKTFGKDITKTKPKIVMPKKFANSFEQALNKTIYKMWMKTNASREKFYAGNKRLQEKLF